MIKSLDHIITASLLWFSTFGIFYVCVFADLTNKKRLPQVHMPGQERVQT